MDQKELRLKVHLDAASFNIARIVSVLRLPATVTDSAVSLYHRAYELGIVRERGNVYAYSAACVYTICRRDKICRTLREISLHSGVEKKDVGMAYKRIIRGLKIRTKPFSPRDYLPLYAEELNLSSPIRHKVIELLDKIETEGVFSISGLKPNGVLATVIYMASNLVGEPISQDRIASVAHVTPGTIRNHCSEFNRALNLPTVERKGWL